MIARASCHRSSCPGAVHQHCELVAAEARNALRARHGAQQPLADLAQHVIADAVSQRVVDVLEAVEVHHEDRQRPSVARSARSPAEQIGELGTVGKIGERILVGELQDALLAVGDARAHVVEARGEHADLVGTPHVTACRIIALFDLLGGFRQLAQRAGDVQRDRDAADDREQQAQPGEHEQRRAQAVEDGEGIGERAVQHGDDA